MTCSRALRITPRFGGACRVLPGPRGRAQAFGGRRTWPPSSSPASSVAAAASNRTLRAAASPAETASCRSRRRWWLRVCAGVTAAPAGACGTEAPRRHRDVHPREPPESSGSYRASGGGLQGCPPRGVPPRWRCGCRARTARRSRRWGRVCESTTTATGRPRGRPPPWRRTGRRRSARRPRRAGCPLTPRLRREHATANGSGLASPSPGRAASQSPAPFVPSISPYAAVGSLTLPPRETRRRTGRGE